MTRVLAILDPVFGPIDDIAKDFAWDSAPMSGLAWPIVSAIVYVAAIRWMTPAAVERKQKTEQARLAGKNLGELPWRRIWTWPLVAHYIILSVCSLAMLLGTLRELEKRWLVDTGAALLAQPSAGGLAAWPGRWLLCEYVSPEAAAVASPFAGVPVERTGSLAATGPLYFWSYVYYLSKWYELLDTVMELQRGAPPPSFGLHVYHHATVMLMSWLWLQQRQSMQWIGLCFNTFVHVVMYAYYALSRAGQRVSWKTLVTGLQVVQFGTSLLAWGGFLALSLAPELRGVVREGVEGTPAWAQGLGTGAQMVMETVGGKGASGRGAAGGGAVLGGSGQLGQDWLLGEHGQCAGGWAVVFNLAFNVTLLHGFVGILAKGLCGGRAGSGNGNDGQKEVAKDTKSKEE